MEFRHLLKVHKNFSRTRKRVAFGLPFQRGCSWRQAGTTGRRAVAMAILFDRQIKNSICLKKCTRACTRDLSSLPNTAVLSFPKRLEDHSTLTAGNSHGLLDGEVERSILVSHEELAEDGIVVVCRSGTSAVRGRGP